MSVKDASGSAARRRDAFDDPLTEALVRARRFSIRGATSPDLRAMHRARGGGADSFYGDRWSNSNVVRSTHGVNCTGSCSWRVCVKFKPHGPAAFVLFALWPFMRLVHVSSAPLGYLTWPCNVHWSRDGDLDRKPTRGWEWGAS